MTLTSGPSSVSVADEDTLSSVILSLILRLSYRRSPASYPHGSRNRRVCVPLLRCSSRRRTGRGDLRAGNSTVHHFSLTPSRAAGSSTSPVTVTCLWRESMLWSCCCIFPPQWIRGSFGLPSLSEWIPPLTCSVVDVDVNGKTQEEKQTGAFNQQEKKHKIEPKTAHVSKSGMRTTHWAQSQVCQAEKWTLNVLQNL